MPPSRVARATARAPALTTSSTPKLVVGKGRRIVFRVRILNAKGLSVQSNKVIIAKGRLELQATSGR